MFDKYDIIPIFLISLILVVVIYCDKSGKGITTSTYNITSLDVGSDSKGRFCMGSGYVEDEEYYFVYEILEDNGKKLRKLKSSKTTVYDNLTADDQAYVEIYMLFGLYEHEIRIYVPEGSFIEQYDFDVKEWWRWVKMNLIF